MIAKGIVSAIILETRTVDVILPEYSNVVVKASVYREDERFLNLAVNDFVVVAVFNDDFNDCIIL